MKTKQKRRVVKQRPRPKHKPRSKRPPPKTQALTIFRRGQLMEPTKDEVALIRSLCAKDANEEEFKVFMRVAKSSRLDPFKKEIYCLVFSKNNLDKRQMVILTGIGGYCTIAARDYQTEYAGLGKPEFTFSGRKTPAGRPIPDSCTIEIKCKDGINSWSHLLWDEIVPYGELKEERLKFWNNSPCNQLEKCTAAKGLRRRFPGLNNIYVDAELDRARSEETPGGRKFTVGGLRIDGSTPTGGGSGQLDDNAAHGHLPGSTQALKAEAQLRKVEEADRKFAEGKTIDVKPEPQKPKRKKEPENPELGKVWPKGDKEPPKEKKPKKRRTMAQMGGELYNGTLHKVLAGTVQSSGEPKLTVQINRIYFHCYRKSIFEPIEKAGDGSVIECFVKDGSIIGLKRVNDLHFAEDGVEPLKREPGDEGL